MYLPIVPSVMQDIGSPTNCFAVIRIENVVNIITVIRQCNLNTILSIVTGSRDNRHFIGENNSNIFIDLLFKTLTQCEWKNNNNKKLTKLN